MMNLLCTKGAAEIDYSIAPSPTEVVGADLSRIAEVNPVLNAVTSTLADGAPPPPPPRSK